MDLTDVFKLPKKALVNQRLTKKTLIKTAHLGKADEKLLEDIESIYVLAVLNESSTGIPGFEDDEVTADEIIYLHIVLRKDNRINKLDELLHKAFPYLTVMVYEFESALRVSTSDKRKNLSEKGKLVIKERYISNVVHNKTDNQKDFLSALAYAVLPKMNLEIYYRELEARNKMSMAVGIIGQYPVIDGRVAAEKLEAVTEIAAVHGEIGRISKQMKEARSFGEKTKLNVEMTEFQKKLDALALLVNDN